ncbi:MAG: hypothetical protein FWD55_04470 [Propionibacteriaceae bacterium]|nr:hypothetical protein [Propionibacteriaceae bacterium]
MDLTNFSAAAKLVGDMSASSGDLMKIAQYHPSLRTLVASHPQTDPALFDWLDALGDPAVSEIIADRRASMPASVTTAEQEVPQPMSVDLVPPASSPALSAPPVPPTASVALSPAPAKKSRTGLVVVITIVVLGLVTAGMAYLFDWLPTTQQEPTQSSTPTNAPTEPEPLPEFPLPGWITSLCGSEYDGFTDVVVASDGTIIAIGHSESHDYDYSNNVPLENEDGHVYRDGIVAFFDADGNYRSMSAYPGHDFSEIAIGPDDTVVIAGYENYGSQRNTPYAMKMDTSGNTLWTLTGIDGVNKHILYYTSVSVSERGFITMTGVFLENDGEFFVTQLDEAGTLKWFTPILDVRWITDVTTLQDGRVIAVGMYERDPVNDGDLVDSVAMMFSAEGELLWRQAYGDELYNEFSSVISTPDGVIVAGVSGSEGWNPHEPTQDGQAVLAKIDMSGELIWTKKFGGSGIDQFHYVAALPNSEVMVVGTTTSLDGDFPSGPLDEYLQASFLAQFNSEGTMAWADVFDLQQFGWADAVATSATGLIVVGGGSLHYSNLPSTCGEGDAYVLYIPFR